MTTHNDGGTRVLAPAGTYSEVVAVDGPGRWIHVAGQLGAASDGTGSQDDLGMQAARAFDGLEAALRAVGAGLEDVVKLTVFVTSFDDYPAFNEVRLRRFGSRLPASTAVRVAGLLGGSAVEVEAVAFQPSGRAVVEG